MICSSLPVASIGCSLSLCSGLDDAETREVAQTDVQDPGEALLEDSHLSPDQHDVLSRNDSARPSLPYLQILSLLTMILAWDSPPFACI